MELVHDPVKGDIRKGPVVAQVLHVPVPLFVIFVEEAIRFAVEFQGPDAELLAEAHVEGRRDLEPAALQEQFRVAVEDKNVRFHDLPEPLRAQMVFYIGKPDPRGNPRCPGGGGQGNGLRHAVPSVLSDDDTCLVLFRDKPDVIGVVEDLVADGPEKADGFFPRRFTPCMGFREVDHHRRVGVDIERRLEIVAKIFRISFCHENPLISPRAFPPGRPGLKPPVLCRTPFGSGKGSRPIVEKASRSR